MNPLLKYIEKNIVKMIEDYAKVHIIDILKLLYEKQNEKSMLYDCDTKYIGSFKMKYIKIITKNNTIIIDHDSGLDEIDSLIIICNGKKLLIKQIELYNYLIKLLNYDTLAYDIHIRIRINPRNQYSVYIDTVTYINYPYYGNVRKTTLVKNIFFDEIKEYVKCDYKLVKTNIIGSNYCLIINIKKLK
jgi:hypothetical protein